MLGALVKSNLDLARATREGLPAETAVQLAVMLGPGKRQRDGDLAAMGPLGSLVALLSDLNRTHSGKAKAHITPGRLTPEQSDVVVRTANALAKAMDVLGAKKKAAHWLTTSNRALGGEVPINLLDTSAGAHEVEALLDRIEYGVYS